jgi:23S rRNA (adenine2503-C2)-methyltransferase
VRDEKWIINVSTQYGCPVGCPFCDAALAYHGNPTTDELLDQVRWALGRHPGVAARCTKLKVHFARMGEPALNDHVLQAMDRLPSVVRSPGLWCCVATIMPRGRGRWFDELYEIKERHYRGRFQLQFSVQSTDEADRDRLIPMRHATLEELAAYGRRFCRPGDRKPVLNFALARDVTFDAQRIRDLFDPACFALKLTPVNPTAAGRSHGFETILRSERDATVQRACTALMTMGYEVILSVGDEREDQIGSNCGQAVRVTRETHAARASA